MQPVEKRKPRSLRHGRLWLLLGVVALLAGGIAACVLLTRQEEALPERVMEGGQIYACDAADVMGLRITLRSGDSWAMTRLEDGSFAVDGEAGYQIESRTLDSLLAAVTTVTYENILTEDWSAYAEHMADFGLETPRIVAEVTYRDGTALTLRIGDTYALEESGWCYMLIDGDSRLYALDHSFDVVGNAGPEDPATGQMVTVREKYGFAITTVLPLLGKHQRTNCAAALMTLLILARHEKKLTRTVLENGIRHVQWPGRFQVFKAGDIDVVLDGAHNPAGIDTFCKTYEDVFASRKRVFLFSVLADKDYSQMVRELFHDDDYVICAPAPTPRSADPKAMAAMLPCKADWAGTIAEGLDKALAAVQPDQVLCIVGSLYIQGEVRKYFRDRYRMEL